MTEFRLSPTRLYLLLYACPLLAGASAPVPDGIEYPAAWGTMQCVRMVQTPQTESRLVVGGLPTWVRDKTRAEVTVRCDQVAGPEVKGQRVLPLTIQPGYNTQVFVRLLDDKGEVIQANVQPFFFWHRPDIPSEPTLIRVAALHSSD